MGFDASLIHSFFLLSPSAMNNLFNDLLYLTRWTSALLISCCIKSLICPMFLRYQNGIYVCQFPPTVLLPNITIFPMISSCPVFLSLHYYVWRNFLEIPNPMILWMSRHYPNSYKRLLYAHKDCVLTGNKNGLDWFGNLLTRILDFPSSMLLYRFRSSEYKHPKSLCCW